MVRGFNDLKAALLAGAIVLGHLVLSAPETTHAGIDAESEALGQPCSIIAADRHPACGEIRRG